LIEFDEQVSPMMELFSKHERRGIAWQYITPCLAMTLLHFLIRIIISAFARYSQGEE
jgi:hypothetical protein